MSAREILDSLDPEQRAVATALHGPVCVLAGAGTGKTRAITHRIAYGVTVNAYDPQAVLAVTFTARAAGEMRTRLRSLGVAGVQARTFHAAALRQLSYFWPQAIGGQIPTLVEHKAPLVAAAARAGGHSVDRLTVRDLAAEIEWAKVSLVAPEDYAAVTAQAGREAPAGFARDQVGALMHEYERVKDSQVVLDFEDILLLLSDVIARHPEIGDTIRRRYRHFVVDEYQDVSPLQQYLLDQWLGDRDDLCVVGDPSQTIYSFAGATPTHLTGFSRTYPHTEIVRLVRNYRSTPEVVALANALVDTAGREGVTLQAQQSSGPAVQYRTYPHDHAEAEGVAEACHELISAGVPASAIAIVYRTNAQSEPLEEALTARDIGYLVRGGQRFFEREEVKKAMVLLRAAVTAALDEDVPVAVRDALVEAGWAEKPPAPRGARKERWDSLQAIVALADDWEGTLAQFHQELQERAMAQHAPVVEGVTLTTIHAAKGLEWEAVFVVGLSEGLLPISLADTDDAIAEERRLLYVAITRARRHLTLSYARARGESTRANRTRTRFLERQWPSSPRRRAPSRPGPVAADLDANDARLFDKLTQWRRAHAEGDGKPAYTVLVDVSLAEIARSRPRTRAELASVRGIGPTKMEKYGAEILAIVAGD